MQKSSGAFGSSARLQGSFGEVIYHRLEALARPGKAPLSRLPYTVLVLLENLLRQAEMGVADADSVLALASWHPGATQPPEFPFMPGRVLAQDFTGVPLVVDLAAMRAAVQRAGGDPARINPLAPVDLIIDHSVQADRFGTKDAFDFNVQCEYARNQERYLVLRWAQQAFRNFRVVPPGTGICHQVNLEHIAPVVQTRSQDGQVWAFPDTLVGTDSHTPMVNGLGVLGWGVGGIEAEAALLGQPMYLLTPVVVGVRLLGQFRPGAQATDLVLHLTELLRKHGVVGKYVEFTGPGVDTLGVADRATLSNMSPEFGATSSLFPVDDETLRYLRLSGRDEPLVDLVERYTKEQGLFRYSGAPEPSFSEVVELDLGAVEPSLAGPGRPQDRVSIGGLANSFRSAFSQQFAKPPEPEARVKPGDVVISAITSCTNTSNPTVMLAAGLLAKKAVERGLSVKPHVKTTLSPGSRAVMDYLTVSGLLPYLEKLGYHLAGFGCMTCIGNSGPLIDWVADEVRQRDLAVAAVLSGNRNFDGRIHPQTRGAYLASPALVVAYGLAGTLMIDLDHEPLGTDPSGQPVFLRDIWPSDEEVARATEQSVKREAFITSYSTVFQGDERWRLLAVPAGDLYQWDPASTYVQEPPFFEGLQPEPSEPRDILGARALAVLGDSITTDHISPAGAIPPSSPAGRYLLEHGVAVEDFNSYGARRGNHEVMMRGTFASLRLRNAMVPGKEGGWTVHVPSGEITSIFDASMRYRAEGTPLVVIGGREYGSGSSRDWAAKGPLLLGVKAVLAQSFERIHRSNLVGMGILPLQFLPDQSAATLGLTGREVFDVVGIEDGLKLKQELTVRVLREDGSQFTFPVLARLDSQMDIEYYRHSGVLPMMVRRLLRQ